MREPTATADTGGDRESRLAAADGWTVRGPGYLERPLVQAHGAVLSLLRLEPGRRFPAHRHPQAQLGILLEGGGRTRVDRSVRSLRAGESYFVPPGVPHGFDSGPGAATVALDLVVLPGPGRVLDEKSVTRELWTRLGSVVEFSCDAALPTPVPPGGAAFELPTGRSVGPRRPRTRAAPR